MNCWWLINEESPLSPPSCLSLNRGAVLLIPSGMFIDKFGNSCKLLYLVTHLLTGLVNLQASGMTKTFSFLSYAAGIYLFSLTCVIGSSLFALGSHFKGAPCMLPLMLIGRLLFGSASLALSGTMTSQDLETLIIQIYINCGPYQLYRTASQPLGLRTKTWGWLLV